MKHVISVSVLLAAALFFMFVEVVPHPGNSGVTIGVRWEGGRLAGWDSQLNEFAIR